MDCLGTKLQVGAPTLLPLPHQTWRKGHSAHSHSRLLTIPRSPITLFTIRSSLCPTYNSFSAINPQKPLAPIRTQCCAASKPQKPFAPIHWNFFSSSDPRKPTAPSQRKSLSASNTQENNNNIINPNSSQIDKLKKIARAGLLAITISVLGLNVQGILFCRPAMAAWYWPFRKVRRANVKTFYTTEEFWANEKIPMEFKGRVLEKLSRQKVHRCEALKGLLITKMRAGDTDRAIEIVDSLMFKEPLELEWRLVKAQIQDYAGRLEEAKQGFEFYLTVEEFNPRALQGLAIVMHKLGEDAAMVEMLEERLQKAQNKQLETEAYNIKLLLAHAYIFQDNLEEALKQYQRLVDENPKDFRPYLCQGILYSVLGKKDEAEERFKIYRNLVPKHFPRHEFLDGVMMKAMTEGRKRFEERKKEEELLAQGKTPPKPIKQPNIGGTIQDLSENESNMGGKIQDLPKSYSNIDEDFEDFPEPDSSMGRDVQDLPEPERSMGSNVQDLPEPERSMGRNVQDLPESESKS